MLMLSLATQSAACMHAEGQPRLIAAESGGLLCWTVDIEIDSVAQCTSEISDRKIQRAAALAHRAGESGLDF